VHVTLCQKKVGFCVYMRVCLAIAEQLDTCNCPLWRKGFAEHYWPPTHTGVATFGCSL